MAFYSGFFNSKGLDRTYTAEDFTSYLSSIICNGILDTYGQMFKLTAASSGLKVNLGTGKAWINGHYFINDARYSIDLSSYQDESLPRYVGICIYLDTTEAVRSVTLKLFPGTPAESPQLPSIPQDADHVRLLMYAVRLNPGATELTERDWYDYREDRNVCGYCRCILGKCKVTDMLAQLAQITAEIQGYNDTVAELTARVAELEAEIEDIGDIVSAGQCGENAYYALYSNGKVLVKGTGAMYDYDLESNRSPFYRNDAVSSLVVSEGITTVGKYVCRDCTRLTSVRYEGSVIGGFMFVNCTALTSFTMAHTVTTIGEHCFNYCGRLETITYEGSLEDWAAVTKQSNWDGKGGMESTRSGLTRIQCLDGYMEWDDENHEWTEVRE